jgi:hypothetical protein
MTEDIPIIGKYSSLGPVQQENKFKHFVVIIFGTEMP